MKTLFSLLLVSPEERIEKDLSVKDCNEKAEGEFAYDNR